MSTRQVLSGLTVFLVLGAAIGQPSAQDKAKQRDGAEAKVEALLREGRFAEAIEPATESVRLSRELDGEKHWSTFDAEHQLKLAETANGFGADQQKILREALAAEAKARTLEGDKPTEALKEVEAALRGFEAVLGAESVEAARAWNLIGRARYATLDHKGSKAANDMALAIRRKTLPKDHPDIARSLNDLGVVQHDLREYEAARKSYTEALAIRRKSLPKDHPDIAQSLNNLGVVQHDLREYEAARKSHTEALAIRRKALRENHPDIAYSLINLGNVQHDLREYEAARKSYTEALAIRRKAFPENHLDIASSFNNLGNVQHDLREYEAARKSHTEALAIRRKALPEIHPLIADSLNNLGNVQRDLREYEAARKSHTEALAIVRKARPENLADIAGSLNNLGVVQHDLGEYEAARKSYTEALAIHRKVLPEDHPDIANSLHNLGLLDLESTGYSDAAQERLAEAVLIRRDNLTRLAALQAEPEQLDAAAWARKTVDLYLSASNPAGDATIVYHRVAAFKGAVTAFQRWARQVRNTSDPDTAKLLKELATVDRELLGAALPGEHLGRPRGQVDPRQRLGELQERRASLERDLKGRSEAYQTLTAKDKRGGNEVRAALPPGTCLIDFREYLHVGPPPQGQREPVVERRLLAFAVKPGTAGVVRVPLGQAEQIGKLVQRWRETHGIDKALADGEADPAVELRKAVWEPLARHLGLDVKIVLVSPDGPLTGLPFAALPGSKANTFLLHEYAFVTIPVPALLPELLEKKPARSDAPSLLLVGDIDFGDGAVPGYRPLPGTRAEILELGDQFKKVFRNAQAPQVLRNSEATRKAFVNAASQHTFLHLATHGFFAQEDQADSKTDMRAALRDLQMNRVVVGRNPGLLSGVVFAGVNNPDKPREDTILTALEAGELDLGKTELVVLSACNTGLGKVAGGEGVLGLQRAFQVAGARTTVASLWQVPDKDTQELMREFYQRLWDSKKPLSRAQALQQAQLWMLDPANRGVERPKDDKPLSPHYWAAFVLSGDWR